MKTLKDMLGEARQVVPEEGPAEVARRLAAGEKIVVIDVRDPDEFRDGHLEAAANISRGFLEFRVGTAVSDPSTPVVLYCQTGLRSMLAAKALKDLGYSTVINLQGGYQKWVQSGMPTVRDVPMTQDQIQRYSRHFLLPQVGDKGQRKLLRSKVLLIGAGGLGSPTAFYLAAAGVGTLGLMDGDTVDITNLQRQILHTTADVGKPKVESATRTLKALNPDVNIVALPTRITVDNVMDIIKDYDLIVDGSDNFETRYLVNDACYLAAAGVGTMGLMDGDVVDITNLQRQVLHTTADVGKPKVESGTRTLKALNPDVNVISLPFRITVDNVMDVIKDYDLVIDGSDNFDTRYLVNDACYLAGKPNVHGSIFQFEGMATVFAPNQGPCYRCLYPTPPPPGLVPS